MSLYQRKKNLEAELKKVNTELLKEELTLRLGHILREEQLERIAFIVIETSEEYDDQGGTDLCIDSMSLLDSNRDNIVVDGDQEGELDDLTYEFLSEWVEDLERFSIRELSF